MGIFVAVGPGKKGVPETAAGYVIQESGCWDWTGSIRHNGYGVFCVAGRQRPAHRIMYERERGPVPSGLVLDHLCRNRACVNPSHLEAVTHRVNILRGVGVAAQRASQTHCQRGHPLDATNTIKGSGGRRGCRKCKRMTDAVCHQRRRRAP